MTLYDFIQADEMEQAEAVWEGKLARTRHEGILLYRIDGFYVEAWYHVEHNVLKKFRPFNNKELLQPYFNIELN